MSKKLKACICGLGKHARHSWLNNIKKHPDFELKCIIDTDTEMLGHVETITKGQVTDAHAYRKISEMLRFEDKPDLMVVATPIYNHHVMIKQAMDAGINVICEKNMASTIYQGKQMLQLALDNPELSTAMGTQRRYATKHWTAKKYLEEDSEIGDLNFIQWNDAFNWGLYREDWRQWLQELFAEDQMIHWFDLLRWITGLNIVQVRADTFIPRGIDWQGSSTVMANIALAHPDDYQHRHNWVWCRFYGDWRRLGPRDVMTDLKEFCGNKGKFRIHNTWGLRTWLYENEKGDSWEEDGYMPRHDIAGLSEEIGGKYTGQMIILEQMKRSIESKGKNQPDNNFRDVFKSFAAVMGAIQSSRNGKAIFVPDYWKHMDIEY